MAKLRYIFNIKKSSGKHIAKDYIVTSTKHFENLYTKIEKSGENKITGVFLDYEDTEITFILPDKNIKYKYGIFSMDWSLSAPEEMDTLPKYITLINSKTGGYSTYVLSEESLVDNKILKYLPKDENDKITEIELKIF